MAEADTGTPEAVAPQNGAAGGISIGELQAQLEAAETRAKQSHDQFLRSVAEMENVRKRAQRDIEAANRYGLERFAQELLPVKEGLDLAVENAPTADRDSLAAGQLATQRLLAKAFERLGTTPKPHLKHTHAMPPAWLPMHPQAHARLQAQAALSETVEWAEVRCASLDRLPLVGALPAPGVIQPSASLDTVPRVAGLWTVSALGSRGLTLSMRAAQLLVARLAGAPLPVAKRHAAALDPARFALKQARKADPQSRSANNKKTG